MKRLFLILTPIVLVAACMKKSTDNTHCYLCSINDSTVSATPALNNSHFKDTVGNYCHYTQAEELMMIKQKTRVDTAYAHVDSLIEQYVEYWTMNCQQND